MLSRVKTGKLNGITRPKR